MPRRTAGPSRQLAEGLALVLLCLAVYLPGLVTTPPIDRDESRFAQASRQMFEAVAWPEPRLDPSRHGGGLVVPMVQDVPRLNKPPLIYWLQAGSAWLFTGGEPEADAIWMYRVPSVAGSIVAVLVTWRLGRRLFDPRAAWAGAALLAVSAVVIFDAHQARADQVLLALTTMAMAQLWTVCRAARLGRRVGLGRWLALWLTVGLGVLVKGLSPVVVLLALAALAIASGSWRDWRAARPMLGLLVAGMVVLPWVIGVAQQVGADRYAGILFDETVNRGRAPKEGHAGPPGYHTLMLWAVFWPGTIAVLIGVAWALRRGFRLGPRGARWRGRRIGRFAELFLLAWIVPTWVFFEVYSTKLPHYVLPTYPALALLTARGLLSSSLQVRAARRRVGIALFLVVGTAVPIAGVVALSVEARDGLLFGGTLASAMLACVWIAGVRGWRGPLRRSLVPAIASAVPLATLAHAVLLPRLTDLSPRVAQRLDELGGDHRPLACTGYAEDSLIYLTRGRIERISHHDAIAWLDEHPDGLLVIRPQDRPPDDGLTPLAEIAGYHFANGRRVVVQIIGASR